MSTYINFHREIIRGISVPLGKGSSIACRPSALLRTDGGAEGGVVAKGTGGL